MTWEELEQLPEEIAGEIELWDGRVVWVRRGPMEHQDCTVEMRNALRRCARDDMSSHPEHCWKATTETNVFFGSTGKSDFVTPDFLVCRCLDKRYQDVRASDVSLAGEVLSPSNTPRDVEAKKARYAHAGIPWYWEILLGDEHPISIVRAYGLETNGQLPEGAAPLYPANYVVVGEWSPVDSDGIVFDHPFSIEIPWSELEF
ncbi:putative restriction endonuclease [Nocardia pseudobrasiliensis]|uniref:Putative restriction endonuclease n=2 Tax=Nocardia pseudobrasiliensis TaxID=45979 RepID=A0A370HZJ3_9NOCA|nr:putative restriction endonuclease [Nocardia pseudobrasiliensis]